MLKQLDLLSLGSLCPAWAQSLARSCCHQHVTTKDALPHALPIGNVPVEHRGVHSISASAPRPSSSNEGQRAGFGDSLAPCSRSLDSGQPVVITIPPGSASGNFLSLSHVCNGHRPVNIDLGAGSEVVLVITGDQMAQIGGLSLTLRADAQLHLLAILPDQELHHSINAQLFNNAKLRLVSLSEGHSQGNVQDFDITLSGEGADADLKGISLLLSDARKSQVGLRVHHHQPRTRCFQRFQSVVGQGADYRFSGDIRIDSIADQSEASQLSHNLLLHDTATVEATPQMRIFADDVKATHGATTGGPAPEALFYLKARGLGDEVARRLYIQAFVRDAIESIEHEKLRQAAAAWLSTKAL